MDLKSARQQKLVAPLRPRNALAYTIVSGSDWAPTKDNAVRIDIKNSVFNMSI
jgi:hypothetical protein